MMRVVKTLKQHVAPSNPNHILLHRRLDHLPLLHQSGAEDEAVARFQLQAAAVMAVDDRMSF